MDVCAVCQAQLELCGSSRQHGRDSKYEEAMLYKEAKVNVHLWIATLGSRHLNETQESPLAGPQGRR